MMSKVVVESPLIDSLFKCSLCHGLMRSATVINECLHRFCKLCITNYFEKKTNNKCPTCQTTIVNPLETLKSDLTFQRLLYKIFPWTFQHEIACKPLLLSSAILNESARIHIDTTIDVYLEYWDISLDLFPDSNPSSPTLSTCYLECKAGTPLSLLEKFIRIKHSLPSEVKIDLFHKTFLLNTSNERLIDVCYCFDQINKNQTLDIRFLVSPFGYKAILNRIRQSKHQPSVAVPTITSSPSSLSSSSTNSSTIDPKLKVKIRRSQTSTNNWYITQSTTTNPNEPVELPDLVNSCETIKKIRKRKQQSSTDPIVKSAKKKVCATSTFFSPGHISQPNRTTLVKSRNKPRRRTRFIPTMVKAPPSIFDRYDYSDQDSNSSTHELIDHSVTTLRPSEMVIVNVEGNVSDSMEIKRTQKTICKVPPYIPESSSMMNSPPDKSLSVVKPTATYSSYSPIRRTLLPRKMPTLIPSLISRIPSLDLNNTTPLDLSLK